MNNLFIAIGSLVAESIISSTGNFVMQIGNITREQLTNILRHPAVNQATQVAQAFIEDAPVNNVLNHVNSTVVPSIIRPAQHELVAHPLREPSTISIVARNLYNWGCENLGSFTLVGVTYLLFARFRGIKPSMKALKANCETLNQIQKEAARTALENAYKTQIGAIIIATVCATIMIMKLIEKRNAEKFQTNAENKAYEDNFKTVEVTTNKKRERT